MTSKSKNVRLPMELVEIIEKHDPDKPPGEVLLEIVKDYVVLEEYARKLKMKQTGKESLSDIIIKYQDFQDANTAQVQKNIDELKTMIKGLELFFTKFGKGKGSITPGSFL